MHHDLDPYVEALEPPTASLQGTQWAGRFVSIDEWHVLNDRLIRYQKKQLTMAQTRALIRELCERMFPDRLQGNPPLWQFWKQRKRSLGAVILELPYVTQVRILGDFMASQAEALDVNPATTTPAETSELVTS